MKTEIFIDKAKIIHGELYDYSLIIDSNIKNKFNIICKKHGKFEQRGDAHLSGQGCGKCSNSVLSNINNFIITANEVHNNKYNYELSNYINSKIPIDIICPLHGKFKQTPDSHLSKHGCTLCAIESNSNSIKNTANINFINKAISIHGNKNNYANVEYLGAKIKIKIVCNIHGNYLQTPNDHLSGKNCPKCGVSLSKEENDIKDFINNELNIKTEKNKTILNGKEIDIYLPEHKLGIEYNGLYWHSNKYKDNTYHLNKTNICEENNIQLLHVFEDEWVNKKEIIKSIIKAKLNIFNNRIFARKTIIKEINNKECYKFLNENNLQGTVGSNIKLGLYYQNELVSVMTFGKKRIAMGSKTKIDNEYEMLRFCNKINTITIGGASKLFKYFIKIYHPKEIITFADRRYSNGNLYKKLGFNYLYNTKPNYYYFKKNSLKRENRFSFRKDRLIKQEFDAHKIEHQIMEDRGYLRIYNSGNMKFIFSSQ